MSTREKVILALVAVALVVGGVSLIGGGDSSAERNEGARELEALGARVAVLQMTVRKGMLNSVERQVVTRAAEEWGRDPFAVAPPAVLQQANADSLPGDTDEEAKLRFTGFLGLGELKIAIINGAEYEEGDTLETHGLVVISVSPTEVVLENTSGEGTVTLPVEEE